MTRRHTAVAIALLATINAFGFLDRVMIALIAEKIKAEFLVTDLQIGLLGGTAFAAVNTLAGVPIARLAERFKRKHVTAGFLLLASAFTAFAGVTVSFAQLVVCRLGMAAGNAATEAPPHSMISDMVPPEKRASAISLFMLGVPIAALLGSFVGGAIAEAFGWRATFLFFGVMGGFIAILCLLLLKEPPRRSADQAAPRMGTWQVLGVLLGNRAIRYLVLGISSIALGSFGVNTFLPAFFTRDHGLNAAQAGLAFGLISGIASLVGTLAGGFGSEYLARHDRRWLLGLPALGSILGAPLFVAGLLSPSLAIAIPIMLIGSCTFYMAMGPAIATLHGSLDSYARATGSALFLLTMHLIGQGLGPPLVGIVSDTASSLIYGGSFSVECAGAAAQLPGSACAQASAQGLRYAIALFSSFFVLGGAMLYLAARAGHQTEKASA
jgi:predicted MFS family arabinose efflux permease